MSICSNFRTTIYDVELDVSAVVYDGEIDEFTVKIGDEIVTELLSDDVIEQIKEEIEYDVSDENIECNRSDDEWKEK